MVNVILPIIAVEFQAEINTVQWVTGLHRLMITALLLIYGKMGDKYGHIRLLVLGLGIWAVLSAIIGLSQDIHQLILFRAFQGVAQGMKIAMPYVIMTYAFPPQERGRAMGNPRVTTLSSLGATITRPVVNLDLLFTMVRSTVLQYNVEC